MKQHWKQPNWWSNDKKHLENDLTCTLSFTFDPWVGFRLYCSPPSGHDRAASASLVGELSGVPFRVQSMVWFFLRHYKQTRQHILPLLYHMWRLHFIVLWVIFNATVLKTVNVNFTARQGCRLLIKWACWLVFVCNRRALVRHRLVKGKRSLSDSRYPYPLAHSASLIIILCDFPLGSPAHHWQHITG